MENKMKNKLNSQQLKAIQHESGPLLIIAGAGTGKTTVITERIKWLILEKHTKPSEVLALTFTEKAAREMEERVDIALPYGYTQMWITTFHAFGEKILRQEALQIGLDPGYRLLTESEAVILLRKNLFSFNLEYFRPLGNPNKFIEGILTHFSRLKDEDISPYEYIRWTENQKSKADDLIEIDKYKELAYAYRKYEELKVKEGLMDFSDLISNTLKLFRNRKNVLSDYQKMFKYILIDEFQDTNFVQNELAILLSGRKKNITVVGDDDQAIYRWRGAAVSNILQFKSNFPEVRIVVLTKNYRSTAQILDSSYKLIQFNNPDRLEKKESINKRLYSANKKKGREVELLYFDRVENEADSVAKKIKELKTTCKIKKNDYLYSWRDFAILVRANNHAEPFVRALARSGIPYQFLGPGMLFKQTEVKHLISYLKLLYDVNNSVALYSVLTMLVIDMNIGDITLLNNFARGFGFSLFEAMDVVVAYSTNDHTHWSKKKNYWDLIPRLSAETVEKLIKMKKMIDRHLNLSKKDTAGQILYYFLEDTGLLQRLTEYHSSNEEKEALNISKFFDKIKTFEVEHEDASIEKTVEWLDMCLELGESPLAADTDWVLNDAVNILTIHSGKGLEFPVVFIVNLVNQRFPTSERREQIPIPDDLVKEILPEGDYHLQEERRLFYVAMTRARDMLFLTAANYYGEGKRERKISTFVYEVLGEKNVGDRQKQLEGRKESSLDGWRKEEEQDGQILRPPLEYLSYSQIDNFSVCPLQYKYRYVLKIPVPTNAAGAFGTSIHAALERFYKQVKGGQKPLKDELLQLLDQVWIPVGYRDKKYEERMKKRGTRMLSSYFDKYYDPLLIPVNLEQVFKIKLSPVLTIGGKIDRVDRTPDGKLEIIDYKTGKRPTDKEISKNLQMTVYALAATDKGIYGKKAREVILTFHFLEFGEKVTSTRNNKQLEEAKEKLLTKAGEIENSSFKPKVGPWCKYCDFKLICEAWR